MRRLSIVLILSAFGLGACLDVGAPLLVENGLTAVPNGEIDFETHVRPILTRHRCTACHSTGGGQAGLDIAAPATLVVQLEEADPVSGDPEEWIVKPCDHEVSRVWQRVDDCSMPPGGECLNQVEVDVIAKWIDQGGEAVYDPTTCPDAPLD